MTRRRVYASEYPNVPPAWYWTAGLHDACIVGVQTQAFPFDYDRFIKEKQNYTRDCLTLKINASGALFDTAVQEIRLYSYKVISAGIDLRGREAIWWLADRLTQRDKHFVLEIDLRDFDADPKEFTYVVRFERAEVQRK